MLINLSYAISVWGGSLAGDKIKPLFVLQKRALRNLWSIKRESTYVKGHTKPLFQKYKILTVYNLYNYMTVLNLGKTINTMEPVFLHKVLKLDKPSHRNLVHVPLFKRNQYQNSFCYHAPKLWNNLVSSSKYCNDCTGAPTLASMKSRLKSFLLKLQAYGDNHDWIEANKHVDQYLTSAKADPYLVHLTE